MTTDPKHISDRLLELLGNIAPDIEPSSVDPNRDLRDQFDFDSMDSLHLATAIGAEFAIDIPERDYTQLSGLRKACAYVQKRLAAKAPTRAT